MGKHDLSLGNLRDYSFRRRGYFRLYGSGLPVFDEGDYVTISQGGVKIFGGFVSESSDAELVLDANLSWVICKKGVRVNGSPGFIDELFESAGFTIDEDRNAVPNSEVENG